MYRITQPSYRDLRSRRREETQFVVAGVVVVVVVCDMSERDDGDDNMKNLQIKVLESRSLYS